MTEKTSEACLPGYFFCKDTPRPPLRPSRSIAFGYDPRARQRNSQCAEAAALPREPRDVLSVFAVWPRDFQRLSPPTDFQNDSARARQASRSAR